MTPLDGRYTPALVTRRGTTLFLRHVLNPPRQAPHDPLQEEMIDPSGQALHDPTQGGILLMSTPNSLRLVGTFPRS